MALVQEDDEFKFHSGEDQMHDLLHIPSQENPTSPFLAPYAAQLLVRSPLLAIGTLDHEGRPWTAIWGGESGFTQQIGPSIIGIRTVVEKIYDPVVRNLIGSKADGEVVQMDGKGRMVAGLGIDLESRRRIKLFGRMMAGALSSPDLEDQSNVTHGEIQLVVKIEQSLGNCPKYLNAKHILPAEPKSELLSDSLPLAESALNLLEKADLFFMSTSNHDTDMDLNYRGGPPGFVRVITNDSTNGTVIAYPEYSGNRLYQSLGNLRVTPKAGLTFLDFVTGNVLYITGETKILVGKDSEELLPHTNLAVQIHVLAAVHVKQGLAFRGQPGSFSPYNPPVRYLRSERGFAAPTNAKDSISATLIGKFSLTASISRFRFQFDRKFDESQWKPGQWVLMSFKDELDIGYSHMRDDDPKSLNDDYLRTFTISSTPKKDYFDITIRNVGVATNFLFRQNPRSALSLPLVGFGGEFIVEQKSGTHVTFIAGGIGITPLLPQLQDLDLNHFSLLWSTNAKDTNLVIDTFKNFPELGKCSSIFVSGVKKSHTQSLSSLSQLCSAIFSRRIDKEDLFREKGSKKTEWYMCTGPVLKRSLSEWLQGEPVFSESFNY